MTLLLAARWPTRRRRVRNQTADKLYGDADDNGVGAAVQSPALNAGTVIGLASLWVI